jgi:hypothetical protein
MSLPLNYCIHFRYPSELIPEDIKNDLSSIIEKRGIISYVKGNDNEKVFKDRDVMFLPIRNVTVKEAYLNQSTGLYHFFLELDCFIKSDRIPKQGKPALDEKIPPYSFVYELENFSSQVCEWFEKVQEIIKFDSYFENHLFFNLNIKPARESFQSQVPIYFDKIEKSSFFQLKEDEQYLLEIGLYNSSIDHHKFEDYAVKINYDTDDLFVTNPEKIVVGANADNRNYKIITKDIKTVKTAA